MSKANIRDTKALLAKLMATENITIEHRKVSTASFNVKTRVLSLPIWQDMDGDMYDLLTGHEVGHAKHTPFEGWHDAVTEGVGRNFKAFLNVLEDARIEKKIKRDYPGLRRPFANAYRELFERNFFGIEGRDPNSLNLIDRINLYFKVGSHVFVQFTDQERKYVARTEQLETWEEVVALAKDIYAYVKETEKEQKAQRQQQQQSDEEDYGDDDQGEYGEADDSQSGDYSDDENGQDESASADGNDEQETSSETGEESKSENEDSEDGNAGSDGEAGDEEQDGASADGDGEEESSDKSADGSDTGAGTDAGGDQEVDDGNGDEDVDSLTDKAFREKEKELVNENARPMSYIDMPKVDLSKIILKSEIITKAYLEDFKTAVNDWGYVNRFTRQGQRAVPLTMNAEQILEKLNADFRNNNNKYIQLMVKEFEMRKNASEYSRQLQSKSGELDMNKLSKYRFSNDLFKKITTVSKGKNHGFVLMLDMSGSMRSHFKNTVDQLLVLVSFCKKINVPFEVYGFSDVKIPEVFGGNKFIYATQHAMIDNGVERQFHMKELITSHMDGRSYKNAVNSLLLASAIESQSFPESLKELNGFYFGGEGYNKMKLSGTPLVEAIISSRYIVEEFKKKTQAEIVNVVHLTDGDGSTTIHFPIGTFGYNGSAIMTDPITKKKIKFNNNDTKTVQTKMVEFVREVTGCNHICFFLADYRTVRNHARWKYSNSVEGFTTSKQAEDFAKENGFIELKYAGYDSYYFLDAKQKVEDQELEVDNQMTKAKMVSQFIKHQSKKKNVRVIATSFVKKIAA